MTTTYDEEQMRRDAEISAQADRVEYRFEPSRREFVQVLGAGIMIAIASSALGAGGAGGGAGGGRGGRGGGAGGGGGGAVALGSRFHIGKDGVITVLCGKVECGQGARAEVTQVTAEEFRVGIEQVAAILGDTELTPNDGATVGSGTTPRTIPAIRQAAAAAREMLLGMAATSWGVPAGEVSLAGGRFVHGASRREMTYGALAGSQNIEQSFSQGGTGGARGTVTPVGQWKVMGTAVGRPNARDIVVGKMPYPSDVQRPGMLYGKVLRATSYGATLSELDDKDAKAIGGGAGAGVIVVRDGNFVGVVAPSTVLAEKAIDALIMGAKWKSAEHPASRDLMEYLWKNARGVPANTHAAQRAAAARTLNATFYLPYVQHSPMEPRAAVAEWVDGKVTVWTGTQNPMAVRGELASAFPAATGVRVIGSDFGGGFGGKHTGECAVEAARLARAAGKPVSLRWTRKEEFTWAYFRPASTITAEATLDKDGRITSWYFVDAFAGGSGNPAVQTPYAVPQDANTCQTVQTAQPLRQGSYRGLGATNNIFARECFMDELAAAAGKDALAFRLAHLEDARLRAVLEAAAKKFDWAARSQKKEANFGVGLACGVEKGSYVAACAEVQVDKENDKIIVRQVTQAFECGAIINPSGLLSQVQGAIIQGLGPVLREEMIFEEGRMQNASFAEYQVPRFSDVPVLDIVLVNRPDLASAGAGETPLMAVGPAVANAVSRITGQRVRSMPVRVPAG